MEFFAELDNAGLDAARLQETLTIGALPRYCASIETVLDDRDDDTGSIYTVWGPLEVQRQRIITGLRFSLLDCPNAVTWSITAEEDGRVLIHATINRPTHDPDFIETLQQFVADWRDGLQRLAPGSHSVAPLPNG